MIQGWSPNSHLHQVSAFASHPKPEVNVDMELIRPGIDPKRKKALRDWADRLYDCALEAGDEGLEVLESNLRELRDEVLEYAKMEP